MWCVTEDLVKVGQLVKGLAFCCYSLFLFFCLKVCAKLCKVQVLCYLHFQVAVRARSMSNDAQLVFCPYNYINNPVIRAPM